MTWTVRLVSLATIVLACVTPQRLRADEVVLANGNRLTGTVTGLTGGVLVLSSDYAEPIRIKSGSIASLSTDKPVELHLTTGEIIKGRLRTGDDGRIIVDQGEARKAVGIELRNIQAINPPPSAKWHGSVTLSGNVQSGNTDRSGLSFGAEAMRRGEQDRFSMRALYNIAQENSRLTTRDAFGALQYDYFFTKNLYGYLAVELLNDTFKDLNLRTVVGPGTGYQVWDSAAHGLSVEAGVAYFSEDLRSMDDKRWLTARLGANYRQKLTEWLVFTDRLTLYPSVENMNDFTLRNEAALSTAIGAGWSLKLADVLDYVNNPPAGKKGTDSLLTAGLQYAF